MEFQTKGVYVKRSVEECYAKTGRQPISIRWIDTNKGDKAKPDYHSRLVARQLGGGAEFDLFAGTPPLEAKKRLFSMAASGVDRPRTARMTWSYPL